jgi:hypothetical protein
MPATHPLKKSANVRCFVDPQNVPFLTVRSALTALFLLYVLWLNATDRGDDFLTAFALLAVGLGLALAWAIQVLLALFKPQHRYRLCPLGIELAATGAFLAFCFSGLPFRLAFPLSRPALERFVKDTTWPSTPGQMQSTGRPVGLLRVLAIRREPEGNLALITHSNMSYTHVLVWCPQVKPPRFASGEGNFGEHWYRYSYGM